MKFVLKFAMKGFKFTMKGIKFTMKGIKFVMKGIKLKSNTKARFLGKIKFI